MFQEGNQKSVDLISDSFILKHISERSEKMINLTILIVSDVLLNEDS